MAVLIRMTSMAEPIRAALEREGIPVISVGMGSLFDTQEAEAARQLFYLMAGQADAADVVAAWTDANLGVDTVLGRGRVLQPRQIQPGHIRFRGDLLPFAAGAEIRVVRRLPAQSGGRGLRTVDRHRGAAGFGRRRPDPDHPPRQGTAMAGGVHTPAGQEPISASSTRRHVGLAPRPGTVRGGPGPLLRFRRKRAAPLLCGSDPQPKAPPHDHRSHAGQQAKPSTVGLVVRRPESRYVRRTPQDLSGRPRGVSQPRSAIADVRLSFSDIRYFFECPYQF